MPVQAVTDRIVASAGVKRRLRDRDRFVAVLADRRCSVGRLAASVGCSKSTIGHLRTGHLDTVSEVLATAIAEALGVAIDDLFAPVLPSSEGDDAVESEAGRGR